MAFAVGVLKATLPINPEEDRVEPQTSANTSQALQEQSRKRRISTSPTILFRLLAQIRSRGGSTIRGTIILMAPAAQMWRQLLKINLFQTSDLFIISRININLRSRSSPGILWEGLKTVFRVSPSLMLCLMFTRLGSTLFV